MDAVELCQALLEDYVASGPIPQGSAEPSLGFFLVHIDIGHKSCTILYLFIPMYSFYSM